MNCFLQWGQPRHLPAVMTWLLCCSGDVFASSHHAKFASLSESGVRTFSFGHVIFRRASTHKPQAESCRSTHIFAHVFLTLTCARCAVALLMRLPPRRCRVAFVPRCLPLPRRPPLGWSKEQRFFDRRWMVLLMLQRFVPSAQLSFTTAVVVLALDGS
jgi:hypothetical protein